MEQAVTILVADDAARTRKGLRVVLEAAGYSVIEAADTDETFAIAVAQTPDLIIMDVEMPPEDGYAVCKRLRAHPTTRFLPILMLTCYGETKDRIAGLVEAQADDYLVKPQNNKELLARIVALLRRYPPKSHFKDRIERAHFSMESVDEYRRNVVVLNIDLQGSSKQPKTQKDELFRILVFQEYRDLVEEVTRSHSGTPVAWAGDGGTTEFSLPADAVATATEILEKRLTNSNVSQLSLRIGIAGGIELLSPDAEVGKHTSQTHNRAGHFQKHSSPNTITVGKEINAALADPSGFRLRGRIDDDEAFEKFIG